MKIRGHLARLSDGRLVFVGKDISGETTNRFIAFRSDKNVDTKFKLSQEAFNTLLELSQNPDVGEEDFPHKVVWKLVERVGDEWQVKDGDLE